MNIRNEIIAKAESFPGIKAGVVLLEDLLNAPSYKAIERNGEILGACSSDQKPTVTEWPAAAKSAVILGLRHPEDKPELDWWDRGNTKGNRELMKISDVLKDWLKAEHGIDAVPLPYHVERGGLFLKDAAVLAGLGIIGRNNLFLHPEWGPRIRLRAILVEDELEPTGPLEGFSPCETCGDFCQAACPQNSFSTGSYHRPSCMQQLDIDKADSKPDPKAVGEEAVSKPVTRFCRECELACPVGA